MFDSFKFMKTLLLIDKDNSLLSPFQTPFNWSFKIDCDMRAYFWSKSKKIRTRRKLRYLPFDTQDGIRIHYKCLFLKAQPKIGNPSTWNWNSDPVLTSWQQFQNIPNYTVKTLYNPKSGAPPWILLWRSQKSVLFDESGLFWVLHFDRYNPIWFVPDSGPCNYIFWAFKVSKFSKLLVKSQFFPRFS